MGFVFEAEHVRRGEAFTAGVSYPCFARCQPRLTAKGQGGIRVSVTEVLKVPNRGDVAGATPLGGDGEMMVETTVLTTAGTMTEAAAGLARFVEQLHPLIQLRTTIVKR